VGRSTKEAPRDQKKAGIDIERLFVIAGAETLAEKKRTGDVRSSLLGLGISLSVAVVPDAYGGVGVAAALALQGNVAEERLTGGAPRPTNSGHGTSAIRAHFGHAALKCV